MYLFLYQDGKSLQQTNITAAQPSTHQQSEQTPRAPENPNSAGNNIIESASNGQQRFNEAREKKRMSNLGRGKGNGIVPKGRGSTGPGWTGAGFDVDGRAQVSNFSVFVP